MLRLTPWETGGSQDSRNGCNAGWSVTPERQLTFKKDLSNTDQEPLLQQLQETRMRLICVDTTIMARAKTWTQRTPNQTNLNTDVCKVKCHCGKTCKNAWGLKIHQIYVRSNCTNGEIQAHCTDLKLSEAGEIVQDIHQSVTDLLVWITLNGFRQVAFSATPASLLKRVKEWMKWPRVMQRNGPSWTTSLKNKVTVERKTDPMTSPTTWQKNALKHCQKQSTKADENEEWCKEERTSIV